MSIVQQHVTQSQQVVNVLPLEDFANKMTEFSERRTQ